MPMTYPFSSEEMQRAHEEWGCSCGPAALAFALQLPIDAVRQAMPDFDQKRFTNPSMMRSALEFLGIGWRSATAEHLDKDAAQNGELNRDRMFHESPALVRIQFTGPWTAPGANPKWAYRHTHWIATWTEDGEPVVFDVNGGISIFSLWRDVYVKRIVADIPRADGGWFPTHVWRIQA